MRSGIGTRPLASRRGNKPCRNPRRSRTNLVAPGRTLSTPVYCVKHAAPDSEVKRPKNDRADTPGGRRARAQLERRLAQRRVQSTARDFHRVGPHAAPICRQDPARRDRPPALVLPPVAVGYVLLLLVRYPRPHRRRLERWFGIELIFTRNGAALATAVMSFPLMVSAIRISLETSTAGSRMPRARWARVRSIDHRRHDAFHAPGLLAGRSRFSPPRWASSARSSRSCRTFPAKPTPCPSRCTRRCSNPAAKPRPRASPSCRWCSASAGCSSPNGSHAACGACWADDSQGRRRKAEHSRSTSNSSSDARGRRAVRTSGCGKSTIINMIAGLPMPDAARSGWTMTCSSIPAAGRYRGRKAPHRLRIPGARLFPHWTSPRTWHFARRARRAPT